MYLGLDLRGGVHFLLQVDMKGALTKRLDSISADLRSLMRDKTIRHGGISREGERIVIRFRDEETRSKARLTLDDNQPDLLLADQGEGTDLKLVATLKPAAMKRIQEFAIKQNMGTLHNRINELGVAEPVIAQQGADRIVVQLPGVQDTAKAKDILGRTATLEIRMVDDSPGALEAAQRRPGAVRHRALRRARRPAAAGQEAGGTDRRPPDRRPARLRQSDPGTGGTPQPGLGRIADLQGHHARERRQAHGHPAHRKGQGRGRDGAGDPH